MTNYTTIWFRDKISIEDKIFHTTIWLRDKNCFTQPFGSVTRFFLNHLFDWEMIYLLQPFGSEIKHFIQPFDWDIKYFYNHLAGR